jgi:ABC-type antimicrobial peptide transport system permease subunit
MFFTYIYRELRRRHRQALLTALGLAVGVGLVVAVTAYASGVSDAQDTVLHALYGVGTDITVSRTQKLDQAGPPRFDMNPGGNDQQGKAFSRDAVRSVSGQKSLSASKVTSVESLGGVAQAVGGLTLTSIHVSGNFAEAFSQGGAQPSSGGSSGGGSDSVPAPSASQAPIKVSTYSIAGVDVGQTGLGPLSSTELVSGRTFTSSETTTKVAVIDKAYAKQNSFTLGDTIKISGAKYTVIGLVTSAAGSSAGSNVYIPLTLAQKMSDNVGKVNQIYVRASSAYDIVAVEKEIKTVLPKATVTTAQGLASQVSGSLKSASQLADTLGKWLAIAALVAAFAVASLLTVSAVSRRVREFGTLKALGWKSRRVVGQVMGESAVTGLAGGVIGVALGIAGARLITGLSPDLKATMGSSVPLPPGAPAGAGGMMEALGGAAQTVTVQLAAPISLSLVLLAVGLALAGGLLAGAFGGWRAARLRPADALRRVD